MNQANRVYKIRQNEEIITKFPHFACVSQRIIPLRITTNLHFWYEFVEYNLYF